MGKIIKLLIIANMILMFAGCSNDDNRENNTRGIIGKFYFTANIFGGKDFNTNRGSCVYKGGRVKKLRRYQVLARATKDGSRLIAFTPDHGKDIEVVDLKTNEMVKKFKPEQYPGTFRWFSDDKRVVFEGADRGGVDPETASNIYVLDLETMETKKITNYEKIDNRIYIIDLSPDEKKVVYSVAKKGEKFTKIKIVDLETKEEKILPFSSTSIVWNPSSKKILIYGIYNDHKGNIEYGARLIIYDPETEEVTKLSKDDTYLDIMYPTNSPDGKKIAYIRNERSGALTVWTMDPDGTNHKKVWTPGFFLRDLNWTK